jgi:hypothetical protein
MTEQQFVCALFALPFILLSVLWLLGLLMIERINRAERDIDRYESLRVPVKVKKEPR